MIKRLRRRFVTLMMAVVILSTAVIFSILYITTSRNLESESRTALEKISGDMLFDKRPGGNNGSIQVPYFSVNVSSDNVITLEKNTYYDNMDDATLIGVVTEAYNSGSDNGVLSDYNLRYQIRKTPNGMKMTFVDMSIESSALKSLVINFVLIGLGIVVVFFFLSIFVSRRLVKPIETAWEQQRQFVADASHELKTPLTVIRANAELLAGHEEGPNAPQREKWIENIQDEGGRMTRLIQTLLDQAKADSGELRGSFTDVDMSYLVNESVLMFEPVVFEAGRQLESQIEDGVRVRGNADQLKQLVSILVDNAKKYSADGTSIEVSLACGPRKTALLRVVNTGDTIPEDVQEKIFTRFYRADTSRAANGSYGLGLSIAKSIAEGHGGGIGVASRDGRTEFTVTLPAEK